MSIFFRFSFFKSTKPRKFDPIPRFYNPEKEYIEDKIKKLEGKEDDKFTKMKSNIRNNFRNSHTGFGVNRTSHRQAYNSNLRLVIILIILLLITYVLLVRYLPQIEQLLN